MAKVWGKESAYCSEVAGGKTGGCRPLTQAPVGVEECERPRTLSVAPPQPHIEMTVHRVTLVRGGGVCRVGRRMRQLHVALGAEPL